MLGGDGLPDGVRRGGLLDVDTEEWVTMAGARRLTGRSRPTILRWVKAGLVRTVDTVVGRGYAVEDLVDAVAHARDRQAATRFGARNITTA